MLAHLAARVHVRYPQPPIMVVLDFGVRLRHPDESAGTCLIAAMCDEATRLEVAEIVAAPGRRAVARHLRSLGFRRGTRSRLLTLPW